MCDTEEMDHEMEEKGLPRKLWMPWMPVFMKATFYVGCNQFGGWSSQWRETDVAPIGRRLSRSLGSFTCHHSGHCSRISSPSDQAFLEEVP